MKRFLSGKFLPLLFVTLFMLTLPQEAWAAKKIKRTAPAPDRSAAFIVNADTGTILYASNADKRLHPASLTKMMTLYLTFAALETGKFDLDTNLTVSAHAAGRPPTNLALDQGDTITVEQCIKGLVTRSANDAASVLAESIAGSESRFAALMTATARKLGMKNTTFKNASGLPDVQQISSARDMSILGRALLKHFPQHYHYFSTRSFTFRGVTYGTHNHLMKRYDGMDGIKTGYTNASGFNLVSTARQGNTRLIGVVFGGRTAASRDAYMEKIMNTAFAKAKSPTGDILMNASNTVPPSITPPADTSAAVIYSDEENTAAPATTPAPLPVTVAATSTTTATLKDKALTLPNKTTTAKSNLLHSGAKPSKKSWGIQVGAYAKKQDTERALQIARKSLPILLGNAKGEVSRIKHPNGAQLYRARLTGLDQLTAVQVCSAYKKAGKSCMTLPPSS